jgi:hypothetical protein
MGLQMSEKKPVTREIKGAFRKAGKKDKAVMLDHFVNLTGYNRKYTIRFLSKKEDIQATGNSERENGRS